MKKQIGPRIDRFVDEYLVDLNGTQAAIRAGYSEKTAAQQASRLLRNVKVQQAIATRQKELAEKRAWDVERLVDEAETNLELARSGAPTFYTVCGYSAQDSLSGANCPTHSGHAYRGGITIPL